jgi:hypothetical protein
MREVLTSIFVVALLGAAAGSSAKAQLTPTYPGVVNPHPGLAIPPPGTPPAPEVYQPPPIGREPGPIVGYPTISPPPPPVRNPPFQSFPSQRESFSDRVRRCLHHGGSQGLRGAELDEYTRSCANAR